LASARNFGHSMLFRTWIFEFKICVTPVDEATALRYNLSMLTRDEERYVLDTAYIPEHIPGLMGPVSKGEAFLKDDYLSFAKENWLIFVGYPLSKDFSETTCVAAVERALAAFRPEYLWFAGPRIPSAILEGSTEQQTDNYYRIDVDAPHPVSLLRQAQKAASVLRVERSGNFSKKHAALIKEFLKRKTVPPMIRELYRAMPDYVAACSAAEVLAAYDSNGGLSALFVVDLSAKVFATYVVGCYSRKHYVAHASDLLFLEMIESAKREKKQHINLGLGVNAGIRRFKEKWGGAPFLTYQFCERKYTRAKVNPLIRLLGDKL